MGVKNPPEEGWHYWSLGRDGIKKPAQKNLPKKNQKKPLKKTHQKWVLLGFIGFFLQFSTKMSFFQIFIPNFQLSGSRIDPTTTYFDDTCRQNTND